MQLSVIILGVLLIGALGSMILFNVFGQVTVKKLRKNPQTKSELGMELLSGWDIINVAQALSLPTRWINRFRETQLSFLYANVDLLLRHTNRLDRILAALFYWLLTATGISTIIWACLEAVGVFS